MCEMIIVITWYFYFNADIYLHINLTSFYKAVHRKYSRSYNVWLKFHIVLSIVTGHGPWLSLGEYDQHGRPRNSGSGQF